MKPASELTLEELSRWARAASSSRFSLRLSARSWWSSMMSESSASYAAVMAVTRRASPQACGRGSPRGISKTFPILHPSNRLNDPLERGQWLTVLWCGDALRLSCVVRYLSFSDVVRAERLRAAPLLAAARFKVPGEPTGATIPRWGNEMPHRPLN